MRAGAGGAPARLRSDHRGRGRAALRRGRPDRHCLSPGRAGGRHRGQQGAASRLLLPEPDDGGADHAPRLEGGGAAVRGRRRRVWLPGACPAAAGRDVLLGRLSPAGERPLLAGQADAARAVDGLLRPAPVPVGDRRSGEHLRAVRQLRPGGGPRGARAGAQVRRGHRDRRGPGDVVGLGAADPRLRLRRRRGRGAAAGRRGLPGAGAGQPLVGQGEQHPRGGRDPGPAVGVLGRPALGHQPPRRTAPPGLRRQQGGARAGLAGAHPLEEGLRRTLQWYRDNTDKARNTCASS